MDTEKSTDEKKSTKEVDVLEEKAIAIGEKKMREHPFMRLRKVDVIDGVPLVEHVDLLSFS